jgi:hypothetical protein
MRLDDCEGIELWVTEGSLAAAALPAAVTIRPDAGMALPAGVDVGMGVVRTSGVPCGVTVRHPTHPSNNQLSKACCRDPRLMRASLPDAPQGPGGGEGGEA